MSLEWGKTVWCGQEAEASKCGQYVVFWSDDACLFLADAPNTLSHGGWDDLDEAKAAMQKYEDNGQRHLKEAQSYRNWKAKGFEGFDVEAANALREQDL